MHRAWVLRLGHAAALLLVTLGLALALTERPEIPSHTGLARTVLGVYVLINGVVLEIYILVRRAISRLTWHYTLLVALFVFNEVVFRSLSLVNLGVAGAALYDGSDRAWLAVAGLAGVFAFVFAALFPDPERRDWTERDVIRLFAQQSPRYARWLAFMQIIYGALMLVIWVTGFLFAIALIKFGAVAAFDLLITKQELVTAVIANTLHTAWTFAAENLQTLPAVAVITFFIGLGGGIGQAIFLWLSSPRRR